MTHQRDPDDGMRPTPRRRVEDYIERSRGLGMWPYIAGVAFLALLAFVFLGDLRNTPNGFDNAADRTNAQRAPQ